MQRLIWAVPAVVGIFAAENELTRCSFDWYERCSNPACSSADELEKLVKSARVRRSLTPQSVDSGNQSSNSSSAQSNGEKKQNTGKKAEKQSTTPSEARDSAVYRTIEDCPLNREQLGRSTWEFVS